MSTEKNASKKDFIALIIIFVALMGAYSTSYIGVFGFSDDYSTYFAENLSHTNFIQWDVMSGRPVYAGLRYLAQNFIHETSDFTIFRIFSVISIISLASYLYFFLKRAQFPGGTVSWCITPILLCCLPSIALFGAWATCFPYVTSILLGGFSYSLLNHSQKISQPIRFVSSFILLSLSFAIYQPTGMAFSLFMLMDNCLNNQEIRLRKVINNVVLMLSGMIASLIFSKYLPVLIYGESMSRSELTNSFMDKLVWFFDKPFHDSVSNYSIFHTTSYFSLSLILLLISFAYLSMQKDGLKKSALAIAIIIGSFSPNLIIAESWVSYRSLVSLELCIGAMLAFGLAKLPSKWSLNNIALTMCAALALISCSSFIYTNFVKQYNQEIIVLKSAIKSKVSKDYDGYLMFDVSNPEWNVFSPTKYDEVGAPSIQITWSISGIADTVRKEMGYNFKLNTEGIGGAVFVTGHNECSGKCEVIYITNKLRDIKD